MGSQLWVVGAQSTEHVTCNMEKIYSVVVNVMKCMCKCKCRLRRLEVVGCSSCWVMDGGCSKVCVG